jgi:2'-5' RNA ligase
MEKRFYLSESKKRLFIAIDIPGHIKDNVYDYTKNLFKENGHIKLVSAPNIHITLKFLGNVNIDKIEKIKKAIKETADKFSRFEYEINGKINAFPSPGNARVIFLEIGSGGERISEIYKQLEDNLERIKIGKEKREFFPHITIARIKDKKNMKHLISEYKLDKIERLDCSNITLFESQLKPHGAEYSILGEFGLK